MNTIATSARKFAARTPKLGRSERIRAATFHIALPRPPTALAICAMVFSRRKVGEGITSILRRFAGLPSASFCRNATQYNLYIAKATDNMSHSLFSHSLSSHSSVLLGADGQKSSDCESMGKDKGAGADGATKYITTLMRKANIPIHIVVRVVVHDVIVVITIVHTITKHINVSVLCGQSHNFLLASLHTQTLISHTLASVRVCFR